MEMNKIRLLSLLGLLTVMFFAGCSSEPFAAKERVCVPSLDKSLAIQTGEKVLSKLNFDIVKLDVEQGIMLFAGI